MRYFGIILLLACTAFFAACGSNSSSNDINGNWRATLTDGNGNPVFGFTTTLTNSSNGLSGSNLTFTTSTPCFGAGTTETGGFGASGDFNGNANGGFTLTLQSGASGSNGSNTLALNGTLNNNTISGTWTLTGTGAGCTGAGSFNMVKF